MLNEHLAPMSRTLLAARDIAPIARSRAGHRAEMACLAEARESLPAAVPGDSAATETMRRALVRRLTACTSADSAAPMIHLLLNAATWTDISAGDAYACDPCGMDDALADTACALAVTLNLMRAPLSAVSPALPTRIENEIRRRVLTPLAEDISLGQLSLTGLCRLLCAVMLGGVGESLRWPAIRSLCIAIDAALARMPKDGSLPGGLENAADTAIALMDAAEVIQLATRGRVNLTRNDRLVCMADYILFSHINDGIFINPGPHTMRPVFDAESLFRFGLRAGDGALCDTSAWLLHNCDTRLATHALTRALNRNTAAELSETPARMRLFRDGSMPDAALMFMRGFNLHIAMTGGTGTNHADAGNICLMHRNEPILIDLGGENCDTRLHSLPLIAGMGQMPGVSPQATEFASGGEDTTCYSINLTGAYPADCPLEDYQRTLLMGSPKQACIRLIEMIQLQREAPVDFCFICAREPQLSDCAAAIGPAKIRWDAGLTPETEKLDGAWRLTLHAPPSLSHNYTFTIR